MKGQNMNPFLVIGIAFDIAITLAVLIIAIMIIRVEYNKAKLYICPKAKFGCPYPNYLCEHRKPHRRQISCVPDNVRDDSCPECLKGISV